MKIYSINFSPLLPFILIQIQFPLVDVKAYPVQHNEKDCGQGNVLDYSRMNKRPQVSVKECVGTVAACEQKESADDLVNHIKTERGEDAAYSAIFIRKLSDRHAGGDPQDIQKDSQKRCHGKQKDQIAGGYAE